MFNCRRGEYNDMFVWPRREGHRYNLVFVLSRRNCECHRGTRGTSVVNKVLMLQMLSSLRWQSLHRVMIAWSVNEKKYGGCLILVSKSTANFGLFSALLYVVRRQFAVLSRRNYECRRGNHLTVEQQVNCWCCNWCRPFADRLLVHATQL